MHPVPGLRAAQLAQLLQFLSGWLARDPGHLAACLEDFVGHPAYGISQLRMDLDRFTFLLGGNDGGPSSAHCGNSRHPPPARAMTGISRPAEPTPGPYRPQRRSSSRGSWRLRGRTQQARRLIVAMWRRDTEPTRLDTSASAQFREGRAG